MSKFDKSWQIVVSDGDESHSVTVPATDETHAMDRALAYCEHKYGHSKWKIWSVNGTVILAPDDDPSLADGAPYRYRAGEAY
jgi:hypothetical protein